MEYNTAEKHPLLAMYVEDGKKNSRRFHTIFIDKSRSKGIISGATAVLTEWPSHLTTCWISTLLFGFVVLFLLLFAAALHPFRYTLSPICKHHQKRDLTNRTFIYVVHNKDPLEQNELYAIEKMLLHYPEHELELTFLGEISTKYVKKFNPRVVNFYASQYAQNFSSLRVSGPTNVNIGNQPSLTPLKRFKREVYQNKDLRYKNKFFELYDDVDFNINIGSKKLLNLLKHRYEHSPSKIPNSSTEAPTVESLEELMIRYPSPRITIVRSEPDKFFENSPLYYTYHNLNDDTLLFAARVLKLWDNSGISFALPRHILNSTEAKTADPKTLKANKDYNLKIQELITNGFPSFKGLPEGIVTVDDEGIHLETKTTCHAFFGEILMSLKWCNAGCTVPTIIKKTLKSFCKRGAVDSAYCEGISQ